MTMPRLAPRASLLALPVLLALLVAAAAPACAQQVALGRLFNSSDERGAIDRQRAAGPAAAAMPGAPAPYAPPSGGMPDPNGMPPPGALPPPGATPPPGAPPVSSSVQLSGVLRGSSGRTTVWLDQVPQSGGAQVGPGQAVSLRLSSGRQLILKPGQSFDSANGSVQEIGH